MKNEPRGVTLHQHYVDNMHMIKQMQRSTICHGPFCNLSHQFDCNKIKIKYSRANLYQIPQWMCSNVTNSVLLSQHGGICIISALPFCYSGLRTMFTEPSSTVMVCLPVAYGFYFIICVEFESRPKWPVGKIIRNVDD